MVSSIYLLILLNLLNEPSFNMKMGVDLIRISFNLIEKKYFEHMPGARNSARQLGRYREKKTVSAHRFQGPKEWIKLNISDFNSSQRD